MRSWAGRGQEGRTQGGPARRLRGQPSSALSGSLEQARRGRARLLPTRCATAPYWTKCSSALPAGRLKADIGYKARQVASGEAGPSKFQFPHL